MRLDRMRALVRGEIARRTQDADQLGSSIQYSDEELDIIINQAIKEFCSEVPLTFDTEEIAITNGVGTVTLNILEILRAEFAGDPVPHVNERSLPEGIPI